MNKYQKQLSKEIKEYAKEMYFDYKDAKACLQLDHHKKILCNYCHNLNCKAFKTKRLCCKDAIIEKSVLENYWRD